MLQTHRHGGFLGCGGEGTGENGLQSYAGICVYDCGLVTLQPSVDPNVALPCQPRLLALLMRELLAEMPNMRRVNQLFGADPVLAGWLLQAANVPVFQMQGQVRSVSQAMVLLGERQLRALLQKAQQSVTGKAMVGVDLLSFQRVSHACAKLARNLATLLGLDGHAAYTAALLHGLGHLVLEQPNTSRLPALQPNLGMWDPRRAKLEMRQWGFATHAVTADLLGQWHLPSDIVVAVQAMEAPMAQEVFDPLAGVLSVAVWCQRAKHSGWTERAMADAFPIDVAMALGIDVHVVLQQESPDWGLSRY